jgi:DNA replication and repair protein RecF
VINHQATSILCRSQLQHSSSKKNTKIGIEKTNSQTTIRINRESIKSQATLSKSLPITIIHPDSVNLITGGPAIRRAFIDWIAFYQAPNFYESWKQYKRILKQRNSCLRDSRQRYALPYWTEQLLTLQAPLHNYRLDALNSLNHCIEKYKDALWKDASLEVSLSTGFPSDVDIADTQALEKVFDSRLNNDIKSSKTFYGIHRSDLQILINNKPASQVVSRGQLKILSILLLISQSASVSTNDAEKGIIAIDDLTAELDSDNRQRLLDLLIKTKQQLIMTTTPKGLDGIDLNSVEKHMFHVKHGAFTEITEPHKNSDENKDNKE